MKVCDVPVGNVPVLPIGCSVERGTWNMARSMKKLPHKEKQP